MQRNRPTFLASFFVIAPFVLSGMLAAQTAQPKPAGVSCSVRKTPMSPGDIAFSHKEFAKAIGLYHAESQTPGDEGERAHNSLVRSLIRDHKISEADTDARAWLAKAPQDSWANTSVGEVHLRKADIDDAGASLRAAAALNFCNAQVHADYAEYLDFTGYRASAKGQMEIAHKLDPVDDEITTAWIRYQPRASRSAAITAYLDRAKSLTNEERQPWEQQRVTLSAPPVSPCGLAGTVASTVIPFHAIRDGAKTGGTTSNVVWGLVVTINGKQKRLQIDTAASGIVLKKTSSAGLSLKSEGHGTTQGFGSQAGLATTVSNAASVKIGDMEFHDCPVETLEKDTLSETWGAARHFMEGQDGLIGIDVFRNFLLTLDFPGHVVKLDPLPPMPGVTAADASFDSDYDQLPHDRFIDPSMASWTKTFRLGHQLFVPVRLNGKVSHLFLIDTGIVPDMISSTRAREVSYVEKATIPQNSAPGVPVIISDVGEVVGAGGISEDNKQTHATGAISLDFGGLRQPAHQMSAFDSGSPLDNIEISGALGAITLRQLTIQIDARDQLMKFTYDPSRIRQCVPTITIDDCY